MFASKIPSQPTDAQEALPSNQPTIVSRRSLMQMVTALAGVSALGPALAQPLSSNEPFDSGWTHGRVKVGDADIFYRRAGNGPPVLLIHGWPQHSLMWHTIGPLLAKHFTVIAPDQRGAGMSSITAGGYDKTTMAKDMVGLLNALKIERCFVAGYDLGAGTAAALARDYPQRVARVAFMEFGLAGFGYEMFMNPTPDWTINSNWHLALFTVPDVAVWLMTGRERELLTWFFYHFAYSGNAAVSAAHLETYAREISKPGALRAGISYYAAVWKDSSDNAVIRQRPLPMPAIAIGGESSAGAFGEQLWKPVAPNLVVRNIERAGHWLGDENPQGSAAALTEFFLAGRV
jgi:pimeloyl-ACP methyl ester carboxylesterase